MSTRTKAKIESRKSKLAHNWLSRGFSSFEFRISPFWALSVFICACLWLALPVAAQQAEEEVVVNLATGRVVICVAKDGIVFATLENKAEAEARPPVVIPLSGRRVAILLGAVEWVAPVTARELARMDTALPRLVSSLGRPAKPGEDQANDIEALGVALLEPLRAAAARLHRKIDLPEDEPLLELILVGYVEEYGPEVWTLRYRIAQDPLRGDYWQTRVLRPQYEQLYPPEKGQPRTLMEARYPPEDEAPALLDLFSQKDPRIERIRASSELFAKATQRLSAGESNKAPVDDVTGFVRAALGAITPDALNGLAVIREQKGFEWILAPPEAPAKPVGIPRPAGAPTLRKP